MLGGPHYNQNTKKMEKIRIKGYGEIGTLYYEDDDGEQGFIVESELQGRLLKITNKNGKRI